MCRVCARTMRKSRDTSRAAFIWRVKTFGQPYHITLSTKSSGVPPTSRNNKFSHIFSPRRALVLPLWAQHNLRTTVLTRGDNHDTDWTKNQNKQKKTLFLLDRRVTSFRTYFFFFLLFFFSSHTVIACERAPLWRRCRRSATQRSLRRGTRLPKPISYLQNTTVDRHTVNATTPPEFDRYSRARIDHTRDDQRDPMYHMITITTTNDKTIKHDYKDSQTRIPRDDKD